MTIPALAATIPLDSTVEPLQSHASMDEHSDNDNDNDNNERSSRGGKSVHRRKRKSSAVRSERTKRRNGSRGTSGRKRSTVRVKRPRRRDIEFGPRKDTKIETIRRQLREYCIVTGAHVLLTVVPGGTKCPQMFNNGCPEELIALTDIAYRQRRQLMNNEYTEALVPVRIHNPIEFDGRAVTELDPSNRDDIREWDPIPFKEEIKQQPSAPGEPAKPKLFVYGEVPVHFEGRDPNIRFEDDHFFNNDIINYSEVVREGHMTDIASDPVSRKRQWAKKLRENVTDPLPVPMRVVRDKVRPPVKSSSSNVPIVLPVCAADTDSSAAQQPENVFQAEPANSPGNQIDAGCVFLDDFYGSSLRRSVPHTPVVYPSFAVDFPNTPLSALIKLEKTENFSSHEYAQYDSANAYYVDVDDEDDVDNSNDGDDVQDSPEHQLASLSMIPISFGNRAHLIGDNRQFDKRACEIIRLDLDETTDIE